MIYIHRRDKNDVRIQFCWGLVLFHKLQILQFYNSVSAQMCILNIIFTMTLSINSSVPISLCLLNSDEFKLEFPQLSRAELKVRQSQKQIMVYSILPKNERWGIFQYIKLSQRCFLGELSTP